MFILLFCLLILGCILMSAFFSGAETALVVADRIRLRHLVEKNDRKAQIVEKLRARPQTFLGTTLVGTNLAIVGGSVLATRLVSQLMGESSNLAALIQTLIMTPLILIFAEIVPKNFFHIHADSMVLGLAPWIRFSYWALRPLVSLASGFSRLFTRMTDTEGTAGPFVTREELRYLARESRRYGLIERQEHYIVGQIFDFAETSVGQVMVPLDRVVAAEQSSTPVDVVELIRREGKSRIPVYRRDPGQIVGVVDINHLLTSQRDTPLEEIVYTVPRVREDTSIERLFLQLQNKREHLALVTDRENRVIGIVTMEDLLEKIVGSIRDEHDQGEDQEEMARAD
jgi:putative hemolysin